MYVDHFTVENGRLNAYYKDGYKMAKVDLGNVVGPQGDPANVNGKTPDENGEITLGAVDIKCSDGTDVNAGINARVNKDGSSTTSFSFGYDAGGLYVVTP